ncbi:hypothetical protein GGQ97_000035 [Sphingomonas kaistensis]|uniref:Uncharacterized protein n=1 Tax=Sphingomonas kaistensis TaxID=298708 RepID=A0A7X5Y2Z7_9SPHN|nr:hypothetical protein [Sphingomonas kaistensis]NJC04242.1 hypothetical protein [Sphingomonas kaistensis]
MKKFLFAAAGLAAVAAATPASAQGYYGQQPGYYPQYGQQYGYQNQQQLVQFYISRADQLRQRVERFDGRDRISEREASRLRAAAIDLQNRTRSYARNGINASEQRDLDNRFAQLQQRIAIQARDGNNRYGNGYGRGVGGGRDRDRDGIRDNRDGYVDLNRNGVDDRREGFIDNNRNGIDDRREGYPYRR